MSVLAPTNHSVAVAYNATLPVQSSRQGQERCPTHYRPKERAQIDQTAGQSSCDRLRRRRRCWRIGGGSSHGSSRRRRERGPADRLEICAIPIGELSACTWAACGTASLNDPSDCYA